MDGREGWECSDCRGGMGEERWERRDGREGWELSDSKGGMGGREGWEWSNGRGGTGEVTRSGTCLILW